jgi:hypothetical protein
MKKKLTILALVALAVLVVATPALADGSGVGKIWRHRERVREHTLAERQIFALTGVITALDLESDTPTITVEVRNGTPLVKPYIGEDPLVVLVTDETTYKQWTETGCVPIDASEVSMGDTVSMQGIVSGETFTANRVTVDVPLNCCSQ